MSMGAMAGYIDTIDESFISKLCSRYSEYEKCVESLVSDHGFDLREIHDVLVWNSPTVDKDDKNNAETIEIIQKLQRAYRAIIREVKKKTGLKISLHYHNQESDGDIYDETDGLTWEVINAYEMTKPAKKNQKHIHRAYYVVYG